MPDQHPDDAAQPAAPAGDAMPEPTPGGYEYTLVDDAAAPAIAPATRRAVPQPLALASLALLPALLVGVAVWFASGMLRDSNDARVGANVGNVVNVFSQNAGTVGTERFEGAVPPGYPDDLPAYPGSHVVSSTRQIEGADVTYLVIYDADGSRHDVAAYFEQKLADDPFQIEAGQDTRDLTVHQFSRTDDANTQGVVLVAASPEDDLATIFISVQVTSGAGDDKAPPFALASSRSLPPGFPNDVAGFPEATVIETQFKKSPADRTFAVTSVTKERVIDVIDYFRDQFESNGWTVADVAASDSPLADASAIQFNDDAGDIGGQVVAGTFGEDDNYTQIELQVRESTSRDDAAN